MYSIPETRIAVCSPGDREGKGVGCIPEVDRSPRDGLGISGPPKVGEV